jgi:tetratricopeptide (TPR) repeat protein
MERSGFREAAIPLAQEGLSLLRGRASGRVLATGYLLAVLGRAAVDETQAKQLLEQGLAIAQEADEPIEVCWALHLLGKIALRHEQYGEAEGRFLTFLRIAREIDHRRGEARALGDLGKVAYSRGQHSRARELYEQSLAIFRQLGEREWIVSRLRGLGKIALASGDVEQARARYREMLSLAEEQADLRHMAGSLCGLGNVALATGDVPAARRCYQRGLEVALEDPRAITDQETLGSLARWVAHKGEPERTVELLTLSLCERQILGAGLVCDVRALLADLRSRLSPEAYATARKRGRARDLEATLRELLAELQDEP